MPYHSELEVDERLQISRDELVEDEDGRDHDEAHQPEREHGEVDAVPAFPTVGEPVDDHAENEHDEDELVVGQDVGDSRDVPLPTDAVDHRLGGLPRRLVSGGRIEVGTGTEEQPRERDEDERLEDAPRLVQPLHRLVGLDECEDGFDERAREPHAAPHHADHQRGMRPQVVGDQEGDEYHRGDGAAHEHIAVTPDFVRQDADAVQAAPNHKVPRGTVP